MRVLLNDICWFLNTPLCRWHDLFEQWYRPCFCWSCNMMCHLTPRFPVQWLRLDLNLTFAWFFWPWHLDPLKLYEEECIAKRSPLRAVLIFWSGILWVLKSLPWEFWPHHPCFRSEPWSCQTPFSWCLQLDLTGHQWTSHLLEWRPLMMLLWATVWIFDSRWPLKMQWFLLTIPWKMVWFHQMKSVEAQIMSEHVDFRSFFEMKIPFESPVSSWWWCDSRLWCVCLWCDLSPDQIGTPDESLPDLLCDHVEMTDNNHQEMKDTGAKIWTGFLWFEVSMHLRMRRRTRWQLMKTHDDILSDLCRCLFFRRVSETPTPTRPGESTAVHLQFVRHYAPHLYRWAFLSYRPWRKGTPTVHLPFVRQYASHLYGSTVEKILGVGVTEKFLTLTFADCLSRAWRTSPELLVLDRPPEWPPDVRRTSVPQASSWDEIMIFMIFSSTPESRKCPRRVRKVTKQVWPLESKVGKQDLVSGKDPLGWQNAFWIPNDYLTYTYSYWIRIRQRREFFTYV